MTAAADAVPVWRNRDFRLVWLAQSMSEFGNGMSQLAYPLVMLAITGSPLEAGALSATRALPYLLLGLPAGALVDRWNRRLTMIVCDVVRALNIASIPVALLLGALHPAQLFVTGFVGGVCYVFFSAAEGTCLPNVVRKEQLTAAVSAQETTQSAVGIAAPPTGGALLQAFRGLPFLVDAVSFLVSAVCLVLVRANFQPDQEREPRKSLRAEIAVGIRWLWRHRALRLIAVIAAGLQIAISGIALVAIVVARDTGASPAVIGGLFSALGVGGVVGALIAPRLRKLLGLGGLLLSVLWFQAVLWGLLALSTSLVAVGIELALFMLSMPCFGVAALSYQLEATPGELLGRVGTAFNLLIWAATPVGAAAAGLLLGQFTPRVASFVFAAWVLVLSLVATMTGGLRRLSDGAADTAGTGVPT